MARYQTSDTMPKLGHVTDLREQWLVRADGALAHRLQDREISSHLCENRYRNQQIREDFPVALSEQRGIDHEADQRDAARQRQTDVDAEIAREIAQINLRRQRRHQSIDLLHQPSSSRAVHSPARPQKPPVQVDIDPNELGLSSEELEDMRQRLEQEERDARLARELSYEGSGQDALIADMRCAVEAQDGELARLLQEREYKKLQRAKEKARQKAILKRQQRLSQQQNELQPEPQPPLLDAYSNPRDMIQNRNLRLSKSVDSDLNYVEPFEKEHIQSKASALQLKEISNRYMQEQSGSDRTKSIDTPDIPSLETLAAMQHRHPPPVPTTGKKPRFPDPVSIRPASHYPADEPAGSYNENNNFYGSTFDEGCSQPRVYDRDTSKRLSVISDITPEALIKKNKQDSIHKKRGCKIQ